MLTPNTADTVLRTRRLFLAILAVVAATACLTGCKDGADEVQDDYRICVAHGGTFKTSDADFSCTLPSVVRR